MKEEIKCHNCKSYFEHTAEGSYPTGPCPTSCPECGAYCCPECGGQMGRSVDGGDEMDLYTSGGCYSCDYTCCGGCI